MIKLSMELHVYSINSLKNYKNYRINVCVSVACPLNFYGGQRWAKVVDEDNDGSSESS